jgi:hypothetical protein
MFTTLSDLQDVWRSTAPTAGCVLPGELWRMGGRRGSPDCEALTDGLSGSIGMGSRTSLSLSGSRKGRVDLFHLFLYILARFLRGSHTPSFAHSASVSAEDFFSTWGGYGYSLFSFC